MHILVSTTTASDLAETAEQSIDYLQKIVDYMISKAHILISALIILIVGWYLTKFICKLVRHSLDKTRLDASVTSFINSLTKFGLRALLAIIVINKLGVDTTSLIALLTSASLAIGLAVQGSLANFAGGVLLLVMKPFVVGDYIDDGNGHEGTGGSGRYLPGEGAAALQPQQQLRQLRRGSPDRGTAAGKRTGHGLHRCGHRIRPLHQLSVLPSFRPVWYDELQLGSGLCRS